MKKPEQDEIHRIEQLAATLVAGGKYKPAEAVAMAREIRKAASLEVPLKFPAYLDDVLRIFRWTEDQLRQFLEDTAEVKVHPDGRWEYVCDPEVVFELIEKEGLSEPQFLKLYAGRKQYGEVSRRDSARRARKRAAKQRKKSI